jgi:serine phosphatase RsbU (regulator of sigma subunit)/anti-sigma regulatory factor (Ser/Thr protein kinase)
VKTGWHERGERQGDVSREPDSPRTPSELILRLAEGLAGAADREQFASVVTEFVADAFGCNAGMGYVTDDRKGLEVLPNLIGYRQDDFANHVIPIDLEIPICVAVRTGELVTVADHETYLREFPASTENRKVTGDQACACMPIVDIGRGQVSAVARLGWPHARLLTDEERTTLDTMATVAGLALARIDLATRDAQDRFRSALDSMIDDVSIGRSVRDREGVIVDFELEFFNRASLQSRGRGAQELIGKRVCEVVPGWRESFFERFVQVVETGVPFVGERVRYDAPQPDGTALTAYWNVQVSKMLDGYIVASRDVTDLVAAEHKAREAERRIERDKIAIELLQRVALPDDLPRWSGVDLGAAYRPAERGQPIGGDWYDAFPLDDHSLAVVIADVAGHGPDAAAFMVQVRNVFRAVAIEHREPVAVLTHVNQVLCRLREMWSPFVTCCYGVLDTVEQTYTWGRAGHLPPMLMERGGRTRMLWSDAAVPLSITPEAAFVSDTVAIRPGHRLVLYTDGLVERRNESLDDGLARLIDVASTIDARAAADLARSLAATVTEPADDIAVLCVELHHDGAVASAYDPWPSSPLMQEHTIRLPDNLSGPSIARHFVLEAIRDLDVDADTIGIATSELVSNAVLHGAAPVTLRLTSHGGYVLVEVHDQAAGRPELRPHAPDVPGGLGLHIVDGMVDDWGIDPDYPVGKSVWFRVRYRSDRT